MNLLKAALAGMFILGFVSMWPTFPAREERAVPEMLQKHQENFTPSAPAEPDAVIHKYNGWFACRRADGMFVGVVRETFRLNDEWFYKILLPNAHNSYVVEELKSGKVIQQDEPIVITRETWMFTITRYQCADGRPLRGDSFRPGKRTEEVIIGDQRRVIPKPKPDPKYTVEAEKKPKEVIK